MLQEFIERLRDLNEVEEFERAMQEHLRKMGFDSFSYAALRVPDSGKTPFFVTTYPLAWITHYANNDYIEYDPILHHATSSLMPFDWSSVASQPSMTTKQQKVMLEASDCGLRFGAGIPVHAPRGGFAMMSCVTSNNRKHFEDVWRAHQSDLHLTTLYYHSSVEQKLLNAETAPATHLTDREREALLWTAHGKTSWETSEIMKISQETVNFHLKNVMRKVGVYSKHHAVVKAIMLGLIVPETPSIKAKSAQGNIVNLLR
jgi:DNA-binding CsgD family transcriptional regulator